MISFLSLLGGHWPTIFAWWNEDIWVMFLRCLLVELELLLKFTEHCIGALTAMTLH